ncbi:MAG: gluconate 2-dehydrogenase subunit 3 family protein [Steroidobacteraceae bacterium]
MAADLPFDPARRRLLGAAGALATTYLIGGCEVKTTPEDARARGATLAVLTAAEAATLDALADFFVPGARDLGLAQFIDAELAAPPERQVLMIKYLGVAPPFLDFYRGGLAGLDAAARADGNKQFAALDDSARTRILTSAASGANLPGWEGPPAPFFSFVLRNDAIDVVYGHPQGFEKLGVPYMPHILPPTPWPS